MSNIQPFNTAWSHKTNVANKSFKSISPEAFSINTYTNLHKLATNNTINLYYLVFRENCLSQYLQI